MGEKINFRGSSNNRVGIAFALCITNLGSIPSMPYGSLKKGVKSKQPNKK